MLQARVIRTVMLVLLLFAGSARAIGPDTQLVNPPFGGVVRILYDGGLPEGNGEFNGTGSIIDNMDVRGQGWLCVLTADHVVSTTGRRGGALVTDPGIGFGNSGNDTGNSAYMKAGAGMVWRGGPDTNKDLAVMAVNYGAFDPTYTPLVRHLVPATAFFNFSDLGYGNEGALVAGGFQAQNRYGTQRYLNEKIGVFTAPTFSALGYTYEAAEWFVGDPLAATSIAGTGTTFDADSGSPYFSTEQVYDPHNELYYATDNQFAVHTGTIPKDGDPAGFKSFGTTNFGVALTTTDITWIETQCALVPEPAGFVLLILGGIWIVTAGKGPRAGLP